MVRSLIVQPMRVRKTYHFRCNKWLSRYEGDRLLEVTLTPDSAMGMTQYVLARVLGMHAFVC
jgi:hypothetical protein